MVLRTGDPLAQGPGGPVLKPENDLPGAPPRAVALSTTSAILVGPNFRRRKLIITNDDTTVAYVARADNAQANAGIRINANGGYLIDEPDADGRMYFGPWSAVVAAGTGSLCVSEE